MKKRIMFVTKGMNVGGVERALIALANSLVDNYDIEIICFDNKNNNLLKELHADIKVNYVSNMLRWYYKADKEHIKKLPILLKIYKAIIRIMELINTKERYELFLFRKYKHLCVDVAVSYTGFPGPWDSLVKKCNAIKKYVYIHNNPYALAIDKIDSQQHYNSFDKIICVSNDIKEKMVEIDGELSDRLVVRYNLLSKSRIDKLSSCDNPLNYDATYKLVTVARLENRSKRFDRLIEAAKILVDKGFDDYTWYIIGDGEDKSYIENKIKENSLDEYVKLEGFQLNPYAYIKNAYLFVLTSDYEGLPITLMEALYLGTPLLVTDFSCASEIVENGVNGFVVEKDSKVIADAIVFLCNNEEQYKALKTNIYNQKLSRFEIGQGIFE